MYSSGERDGQVLAGETGQAPAPVVLGGKHLSFKLGEEFYAIAVSKVREIVALAPVTPVPGTPKFVAGVMNLRGKIVPIIDLRIRFGMSCNVSRETCFIVLDFTGPNGHILTGIIVDAVCEVHEIRDEQISPVPSLGARVNTAFLLGLAHINNTVQLLLNIEKVLSDDEAASIDAMAGDVTADAGVPAK